MSRTDPRLFIEPEESSFRASNIVTLPASQTHYLGKVMRLQPGNMVTVFNGRDGEWKASIEVLQRHKGAIRLLECVRPQEETIGVELLFSPLKRDATELVIRMGTELGVTRFRPVIMARTNTHRVNIERLTLIAREAAEQCERLDVPEIVSLEPLAAVLARWPARRKLAVALERMQGEKVSHTSDALLVGPEGGFSSEEVERLMRHESVKHFSLGKRVLKAETAAAASLVYMNMLHQL